MSLTLTTAPSEYPISLDDLKGWVGFPTSVSDNDEQFQEVIYAATNYLQRVMWRQFLNATFTWKLGGFPHILYPPNPPLSSVTSITYLDLDGNSQTLSTSIYQVVTGDNGSIHEAYNQQWPTTRSQPEAVTVTYVAGYGTHPHDVPEDIRHALLMTAGHWWNDRSCMGSALPAAAKAVCNSYGRDERRLVGV